MHILERPIIKNSKLWYILVSLTLLIILTTAYVPQIARYTRSDAAGKDNLWLHAWFAPDYHVYLSAITLGQHGYTLFRNSYTTESLRPLPYYFYYIAFGWTTGFLHIWPPYVYHLAKLVAIIIFVSSVYYLARVIFKKSWRAGLATIITIVTTTLPEQFYSQRVAASFWPWWQDHLFASERLDYVPHYVLAEGLLVLTIALFIRAQETNKCKFIIATSLSGALAALMVPHSLFPFLFIVGMTCIMRFFEPIIHRKPFSDLSNIAVPLSILILPVFTIWILQQYALSDIVWLAYRDFEVTFWNRDPLFWYHLYVTFIPILIPSMVTWVWAFRHKRNELLLLAGWSLFPILLYPFTDFLLVSKMRLLQSAIEVPLAMSATYALTVILPKYMSKIILIGVTVLFILYSFAMIGVQSKVMWDRVMREYAWYAPNYVPKGYIEAVDEVGRIVPPDAHILSGHVLGSLLPSFNPVVTFVGGGHQTYKEDEKIVATQLFYSGSMTNELAHQFLVQNGISYVIDDGETKQVEARSISYPFLQPIWRNASVSLYKIK